MTIDSTDIRVGTLLNGRYHLEAELGRGGMGVVYRAHDTLLDRDVAIKVLSSTALSPESRARLLREARAAAQLNHPNIVSVYDIGATGEAGGVPFIVMELVDGGSLYNHRPRALDEILSIAQQVCAALEHAHTHGIVHCDLKPENIILTPDPSPRQGGRRGVRVKLTDFGLAHTSASRLTTEGAIVGSVFYLAPEQALGGDIDGRADLYALGVMLYELTAGRLPFTGDDPLAVISQHLHMPVVPPSTYNATIPLALDSLIVQLLSKRPAARPPSSAVVQQVLGELSPAAGSPRGRREMVTAPLHARTQGIPLLRTKLYVPPVRAELVSRPRLIERVDAGLRLGRKLTLLSAPAGFGKTTLVSDWLQQADLPVAWVSLDADDNDPARFWAYVIAALQTIPDLGQSGVGESTLAMLDSPRPPSIERLLIGLINEIAESAFPPAAPRQVRAGLKAQENIGPGRNVVLVLDDLHVIENPEVHDALTFLLDNLPLQLHVVIATRADPPLPLSRLRGRAQLTELHAADLRFTPDEVVAFLNQVMGLGLSTQDVAALETRTEGWIVGLQMAALALQGTLATKGRGAEHISGFISAFTGSHRYILDYLSDEVLSQEPEHVQAFLLRTSVLDRLSGPLCDAVYSVGSTTGPGNGQEMLERLDAANLFILPLDEERHWYRYHHLFAELLRKRLLKMHPDLVPALHRRASEWYQDAGLIEEAVAHAFTGEDYERAADLIERNAMHMITHSKLATLSGWLDALPGKWVPARPWLCVYHAWTRYWTGRRDQVEECLRNAEQALESMPSASERELVGGCIAAIHAHHALTNQEIPRVVEMAQRALDLLPEGYYMRCEAAIALGGAYWGQGDVVAAQQAFAAARTTARLTGSPLLAVPAACYVGMQQTKRGQLHEAYVTYHEALEWAAGPSGRPLPIAGFPFVKLGDLHREWDDLKAASRNLDKGVELCVQLGQADVLTDGYVALARLQLAQRDWETALDTLHKAEQIVGRTSVDPFVICWLDDCRLRLWLSTGNLSAAVRWAETSGLRVDGELSYHYDLHHVNLARVRVAQGVEQPSGPYLDSAQALLARLLVAAQRAGWIHEEIKILILQALALQTHGDNKGALAAIGRALTLAEPGGYARTFIDEGLPMARLLYQAIVQGIAPDYAGKLLAAFEPQPATPDASDRTTAPVNLKPETLKPEALKPETLIEPLSGRETQVLELIAEGLTNREIGQRLFISQGTVKAHTSNIYGKLGVRSRTQAVARARALGILHLK